MKKYKAITIRQDLTMKNNWTIGTAHPIYGKVEMMGLINVVLRE